MLKIFRKIRQQLLSENNFSKYLLYAAGEILLVMIGILLALQVNNWNEHRKNVHKEQTYLQNIKSDLAIELENLRAMDKELIYRISLFKTIDTSFYIWGYMQNEIVPDIDLDKIGKRMVFKRGKATRLKKGTYDAIKDNGEIRLIRNEQIYLNIQEIYEGHSTSQESNYETLKKMEFELGLKYSKELKYMTLKELFFEHPDKEQILADLAFYYTQFMLRHIDLRKLMSSIESTVELIDKELSEI